MFEATAAGGEMPIAYALRVMRDEKAPDLRRDAMAKVAAAYLYPRIAASQVDADEASETDGEAPQPPEFAQPVGGGEP